MLPNWNGASVIVFGHDEWDRFCGLWSYVGLEVSLDKVTPSWWRFCAQWAAIGFEAECRRLGYPGYVPLLNRVRS